MRDYKTRRTLFNWLMKHDGKNSIIFLQETHSDSTIEFSWQNQWRGEMYFSHGSSNSKGCITLIGKNVDINIQNNTLDRNGRYIITKCTIQDSVFYLINVYGPNLELEQVKCYTSIVNELSELGVSESDAIIWGGDFQLCLL